MAKRRNFSDQFKAKEAGEALRGDKTVQEIAAKHLKWSQKTGQSAKVYPKPLKGYENGKAPELYRSV